MASLIELRGKKIHEWVRENIYTALNGEISCEVCGARVYDEYQHARWHMGV